MIPFERFTVPTGQNDAEGKPMIRADLSGVERELLAALATQLLDVLFDASDPATKRLLPDSYHDDPEAAAEFRRLTEQGLTERKAMNARALLEAVNEDSGMGGIVIDELQATAWLRVFTDLRLTIATRLGIESDDDEGRTDAAARPLQETYYWLGALQEALVQTLER